MNSDEAKRLRKRIADLHTMIGAEGAEAESARARLLARLADYGKTWTQLTLTIQVGLEHLAPLSADELAQLNFASFAPLLIPDNIAAISAAHEQVGTGDSVASAQARQEIKDTLAPHGLNWTDLSNVLRHFMEQIEDWQPDVFIALLELMNEFVSFKRSHDAVTSALWFLHTYVYDRFMHTPRLGTMSWDPQSGKSVLITQLGGELTNNPLKLIADAHVSASLYWLIDSDHPTVLLDEAQNTEVRGTLKSIINGGFDKSFGGIPRRQGRGGGVRFYNCFAPLAFCWNKGSAIAPLPLDTLSRCIVLDFETGPAKRRYDMHDAEQQTEFAALKARLQNWAITVTLDTNPALPKELGHGRIADCWRPLISIADAIGHGDMAREAATAMSKHRMDESARVRLLRDMIPVFEQADPMKAGDLLIGLRALEECSLENNETWNDWTGESGRSAPHALTKNEMMKMLRSFGIYARTVWPEPRTDNSKSFNGYMRAWFEPLWSKHCPDDNTSTQSGNFKRLRVVKN